MMLDMDHFLKGAVMTFEQYENRASELSGYRIIVSPYLPLTPSDTDNAVRIVRHGMKDVLEWLGEKVGPKPYEEFDFLVSRDTIFVSEKAYLAMKEQVNGVK